MSIRSGSKCLPAIALVLAAGPLTVRAAAAQVCFLVTDAFGKVLPYRVSEFSGASDVGKDGCVPGVSPGVYRYKLQHATVKDRELGGKVFVENRDVLVVLADTRIFVGSDGARFATDAISPKTLDVRLSGHRDPARRYWVKISSLFGSEKATFPLDDSGRAEGVQRWLGRYLVMMFADGDLLAIREVEFRDGTPRILVRFDADAQPGTPPQR